MKTELGIIPKGFRKLSGNEILRKGDLIQSFDSTWKETASFGVKVSENYSMVQRKPFLAIRKRATKTRYFKWHNHKISIHPPFKKGITLKSSGSYGVLGHAWSIEEVNRYGYVEISRRTAVRIAKTSKI